MSSTTITEAELIHLSNLIAHADAARDAVADCVKAYKEKYGLDGETLKSFAKSKFGESEKHQAKLEKHIQFVELDEQFGNL